MTPQPADEKLSANVLHALDLGVDVLRQKIADLEAEVERKSVEIAGKTYSNQQLTRERDEARANFADRSKRLAVAEQARDNSARVRGQYDEITLALYYYVVELEGHRDTAKTKAERIALGHVVERLKEIRGWNSAETADSEARSEALR